MLSFLLLQPINSLVYINMRFCFYVIGFSRVTCAVITGVYLEELIVEDLLYGVNPASVYIQAYQ